VFLAIVLLHDPRYRRCMLDFSDPGAFALAVIQIVWIDLVLSGDNAVVIALACKNLPERQRRIGIFLGAGTAVTLRIFFALIITFILGVPYLKLAGAVLLFWIAVKLIVEHDDGEEKIASADNLWGAVRTIAIADAVMSLDNVIAIAAASRGNVYLFIFALLLSIPLVVVGSQLILRAIQRFPVLVWIGAGILGWVIGEMVVTDIASLAWLKAYDPSLIVTSLQGGHGSADPRLPVEMPVGTILYGAAVFGVILVIATSYILNRRQAQRSR
jgi:YjbE family integral membrane protein